MSDFSRGAADSGDASWYERLLEKSSDLTIVVDSEDRIRYASAAVARTLGYDPNEVTGNELESYVAPPDREEFVAAMTAVREQSASSRTVEVRFEGTDSSWYRMETVLQDQTGDAVIDGLLVTARPMDERTERNDSFQRTNERLELALEGANIGVWDWDMERDVVERDELLTEMLGYTPAEMGYHIEDWERLVHPAGKTRHNEALAEHLENRTPYYQCEYRMKTDSGNWKWVRTIGKVVERDGEGTPTRAVGIHQDIDDRKRAELALQEERDLFGEGPAVVFEWRDEEGWPIEYVSENVADLLGYAAETLQAENRPFADLVHEADLTDLKREVAEQNEAGEIHLTPNPYRVRTASGEVRWVMEYTKRVQDGGETGSLLGYLVDITERKAREEKYRTLFENSRDALMLMDRDGYLDCNDQALELFGIDTVAAFTGYSPWGLSPETQPDGVLSKEAALERIEEALEEGEAFFEWTHKRVDGTEFPAEVKLSRFEYEGELVVQALVRDITERKEQKEELAAERNRIRAITNAIPDVTIVYDREGTYREVLTGQEELLVDDSPELVDANVTDVLDPEVASTIIESIEKSLDTGTVQTVEYTLELAGETTWFEGRIAPLPGGERDEAVLLARDSTELKEYESELETQRDNLQMLNQVVRHDIRNDLQLVLAYAETLKREIEGSGQDYLDQILEAARDAVEITKTARDVTEILLESEVEPHPKPLSPVLESEVETARESQQSVVVTVDGSLPAVEVVADDMLESIFRNVLKNAIIHNDKPIPEVTVSAAVHEEVVEIAVADNGPGIPDERKAQIFEEGAQGIDSEGTGLGLYLAETLLDRYGGSISVTDNEPEGAVFTVELPLVT